MKLSTLSSSWLRSVSLQMVIAASCGFTMAQTLATPAPVPPGPSEDAMRAFLKQGKWSASADDNISGEVLDTDFIKSLVAAYQANPKDPTAIANLSLIPLALAVAEWGVSPSTDLPPDPVKNKNWGPVASTGDGKHLMSYALGGIGVMHQDSGGLAKLMAYIEANHPDAVPSNSKNAFSGSRASTSTACTQLAVTAISR